MKTSELTGAALDWAVAKCEGLLVWVDSPVRLYNGSEYKPSTDWSQGGPIIEREKIELRYYPDGAHPGGGAWLAETQPDHNDQSEHGPTPLTAAMRCYVASKLGDEVETPEELK